MSIKRYFFTLFIFITSFSNLIAQNIVQGYDNTLDIELCKSEYVYEGDETTPGFYEVMISLEPVAEYYSQTFFLNQLLKAEGFYFQLFENENLVSFLVSRQLFSNIPVGLVHEFYNEANANQQFLPIEAQDEYLSMYHIILPGKDWSLVSGYRTIQSPLTENALCEDALPFCTGSNYTFPAGVNSGSGQNGPNYDCLGSTPNPAWYYMKIDDPGNIVIYMYSTPSKDIDFCCWGPFDDPYDACSQLTGSKVVDCSYSPNATETCNISNGQTGEYYILIITNYSNQACNINFSQTGGNGTTDCTILPPEASSNSPVCEGDDIELYAASQNGASYHWVGPMGFSSNQRNPVIENATQQNSGPYTLTITQAAGSSDTTLMVFVKQHPTGHIYGDDEICSGDQSYLFFDLTGDSPWDIRYTDGTNIYDETTFLNQYSIFVSPTSTTTYSLVEVMDEFCYAEELTGEAVKNIHPQITTLNLETVCNEEYTHYTVSFLITGGTPGTYEVTPPGNITPGPTAIFTSNPIAEGTPFSFSIVDEFDCDPVVVSGVKDCDCPAYGEIVGEDTICSGQSTDIEIDLSGEAPWSITYTANGGSPVTIDNITETPYYLSVSPTETTEYKLTYVGDQFCDGTAVGSALVNVFPQPVSQYEFEGICETEETLFTNLGSVPAPGVITSYLWDFDDSGATSTDENPVYTFSTDGDFEVSLTITSDEGCADTYTETITVADFVDTDAGDDQVITYGTTTTLEGSVSGGSGDFSYQWQPSYKVENPNDLTTNTNNLYENQTFFLTAIDNVSGCEGESSVFVELDGFPLSSTPESSPSQACYGHGIQLSANAFGGTEAYTYSWTSDPAGYTFEIANPAIESLTESTTFYVTINDGFNDVQASVFVPVNPNPDISAGDDIAIDYGYVAQLNCETLGGGSNFSFYWDPEEKISGSPYMQSPTTINLSTSTNFNVTATNEFGCDTDDDVFVEVIGGPLSAAPYIEDDKVCHLDTITLFSGAGGGGGNYQYQWSVSPGTWTSTDATPEFPMLQSGNFTFSVEVSDDYNSISGTLDLTINPLPAVDLTADFDSIVSAGVVAVCVYDSVYLDAQNDNSEYIWSTGSTDQVIQVGSTGIGSSTQEYDVLITDKTTGCSYNAEIMIIYSFAMCSYFIEELNGQTLSVEMYPNPSTEKITLSVTGIEQSTEIIITDITGKNTHYRTFVGAGAHEFSEVIDISNYPEGIYLITFISGEASCTQKIIKTATE